MIATIANQNDTRCAEKTPAGDEIVIEDAVAADAPDLMRLLESCKPDTSSQTIWDLPWTWSEYRIVRDEAGRPIAAGALSELDTYRFEIRGLAVAHNARGRGLASALVADLLDRADRGSVETVCMTRRPSFFRRFGFECTEPMWLPERRWIAAPAPEASPRVAMHRLPYAEVISS